MIYTIATRAWKYKTALIMAAALAFGLVFTPSMVGAQTTNGELFGFNEVETGLDNALGNENLVTSSARIINVALGLLGIVAVVIILAGGFKWMTAGGNEDKVAEARKLIFAGIIGLAIILSAWAIARFVIENLATATNSGQLPT